MPLIKSASPKAFSENVRREMDEGGTPMKQALAIAYAKKREAERRKKLWRGGYADGGDVAPDYQDSDLEVTGHLNTSGEPHTEDLGEVTHPMEYMSLGGEVFDEEDEREDYEPGESTKDVVPAPALDPRLKFYGALKRRPRRMR